MVDIVDLRRETPEYVGDERGSKKQRVIALLSPFRRSNDLLASLFLLFDLTAFVALTAVLVRSANHRMAPFLSAAIAVFIARLFIIGHDCCHGAFFSGSRANAMCGRIAMLPGLVPFSPWAVGHNTLHHGYTGLRTRDYTFQPLSADEFLALSSHERLFYRSPARLRAWRFIGFGSYGGRNYSRRIARNSQA